MGKRRGRSRADSPLVRDEHGYPVVLGGQSRSPERQARDVRIGWWIAAALVIVIAVGAVLTVVGVLGVVAR